MFTLQTHVTKPGRDGSPVIVKSLPYVRIAAQEEPPIFIQNGAFYYAGGEQIKVVDLPDWAGDMIAKMTPEARREVGLK